MAGKKKKNREDIPRHVAARVLFLSDRVCCVCRTRGKPVQIHHIDEDPSNNGQGNLSVLCFDCHRDTQIRGGFDRKLDSDQVVLYRDDWIRLVAQQRAREDARHFTSGPSADDVELATSIAEIYREAEAYDLLAMHYGVIGNVELRDKYIEKALSTPQSDDTVLFLRGLQGRIAEVPADVVARMTADLSPGESLLQRGRANETLGRHLQAVKDYVTGIRAQLDENRLFTAAFYLKELGETGLIDELFVLALKQAEESGDLWWQVRALQELGWTSELNALLLAEAEQIETGDDLSLLQLLAEARGDKEKYREMRKLQAMAEAYPVDEDEDWSS